MYLLQFGSTQQNEKVLEMLVLYFYPEPQIIFFVTSQIINTAVRL